MLDLETITVHTAGAGAPNLTIPHLSTATVTRIRDELGHGGRSLIQAIGPHPPSMTDHDRPPPQPGHRRHLRHVPSACAGIGGRSYGTADPTSDDGIEWCRPHPYTLIIEFVSSIRDLIIPIVFLTLQGGGLGELLPLVAIVPYPSVPRSTRYYSTRYALTEDALLHDYGVFKKHKQVLPRRNIQNLSTSAGSHRSCHGNGGAHGQRRVAGR